MAASLKEAIMAAILTAQVLARGMEDRSKPPEGGEGGSRPLEGGEGGSRPLEGGEESSRPLEGGDPLEGGEEDEAEEERLYWEEENRRLERLEQQRLSQVEDNPWCLLDEEEEEEEVREARKALLEEVERQRMLDYYDSRVSAAREQLLLPEEDSEPGSQVQAEVHLEMGPEWERQAMGLQKYFQRKHSEFAAEEENPWQQVFVAQVAEDRRRNKRARPEDGPEPPNVFPRLQKVPQTAREPEAARVPKEEPAAEEPSRAAFQRLQVAPKRCRGAHRASSG